MKRKRCTTPGCNGWQRYTSLGLCLYCYQKRKENDPMGEKCSMIYCDNTVLYKKLKLCRPCYGRVWWVAKHYGKSKADAKASLVKIDKLVQKEGLESNSRVFQYSGRDRDHKKRV